jgi:hypothetical protein
MPGPRSRFAVFLLVCAVAIGAVAYVFRRAWQEPPAPAERAAPAIVETPLAAAAEPIPVAEPHKPPPISWKRVYFRWTEVDDNYGKVGSLDRGAKTPSFAASLRCEVVYAAAGRGICLQAERGVFTRYQAIGFDRSFSPGFQLPLGGIPSRTRVSSDGRLGAATVFLTGHSYASVDFTTQTLLLRLPSGEVLGDLETFRITKDDKPFRREDFNFWGVTFAPDSNRFYCTLSTARKHYLVEGDVRSRTARVIHENVECPSLSPDATRIAYKKRLPGSRAVWQLHVLDLATGQSVALAERRNVDDQLEWLDNRRVLYALPRDPAAPGPTTDVWAVAADGSAKPALFLAGAYSPAVER